MNRRLFLKQMGMGVAALTAAQTGFAKPKKKPNIIVIMCDDMGYSDIGCYGGEVETPNIDRLASKGIRFRQFYNTARCCPSRAALLTGLYPHQAGIGGMVGKSRRKGYEGYLTDRGVTVAEVLKGAGYQTRMVGKWHVSPHDKKTNKAGRKESWPLQRGFDKYWGTVAGAGSFYYPKGFMIDNEELEVEDPDSFYYTHGISDKAAENVRACVGNDKPLFMYVAYTAPHWPLHALQQDIDKYKDRFKAGWDILREERHQRMIAMGVVDQKWPLPPREPDAIAWEDAEDKEWQAYRMAVYAAQIDAMDQGIGRIIAALEEKGALDNTLIMFLSDNGGCNEVMKEKGSGSLGAAKERGLAKGWAMNVGNKPGVYPGPKETFQSYGQSWANFSNTPFRRYKKWAHEGGIATPLVACWPAVIKQGGEFTDEIGHIIDLMPTCIDVAGAKAPKKFNGKKVLPVEGKSLAPLFATGKRRGHEFLAWEHIGNRAIRRGKWKLVMERSGDWELYDMDADRTELNDLSKQHPEIAKDLLNTWNDWAKRVYVK